MEFNFIKISNSFSSGVDQPLQGSNSTGPTSVGVTGQKIATITDSQTVSSTTASQSAHQFFLLPTKQSLFRDVLVAAVGAAVWTISMFLLGIH